MYKYKWLVSFFLVLAIAVYFIVPKVIASDHDDGETDYKARNLNLTDLYVFRESSQNSSASDTDLMFIMNSNPRSLPKQQYFFATKARYEFHITRVLTANKGKTPTGSDDVILRFTFADPDTSNQQAMTVTAIRSGVDTIEATKTTSGTAILTTPHGAAAVSNTVDFGGTNLVIFAGLRQDPFFFDVTRFFKVRNALAASSGTSVGDGFASAAADAIDFTKDYNVNAIVVRVPRAFLQTDTDQTVFDVWETISIPE